MSDRVSYEGAEDRTLPAIVYALYLLTFATGVTWVIGLIIAYANRDRAGVRMRSHYTLLIRTAWMAIAWALAGAALMVVGVPLSFVLIGIPLVALAGLIWALVGVWWALRVIVGLVYLSRDEAYPRPYTWLA
jgi:uncharacterized membrane protein